MNELSSAQQEDYNQMYQQNQNNVSSFYNDDIEDRKDDA